MSSPVNILHSWSDDYESFIPLGQWLFDLQQRGPMVIVKHFGGDLLSSFCMAFETSHFGLKPLDGKSVICDIEARRVRTMRFVDHFVSRSEKLRETFQWVKKQSLPTENSSRK